MRSFVFIGLLSVFGFSTFNDVFKYQKSTTQNEAKLFEKSRELKSDGFSLTKSKWIFVSSTLSNLTNQESVSLKLWSSDSKLKWTDFQGIIDTLSSHSAMTSVRLQCKAVNSDKNSIVKDVKCYFIKSQSWTKDKSSKALLSHEQLHFDIAELSARQIRYEFKNYIGSSTSDDSNNLEDIIYRCWNTRDSLGHLYDKETAHCTISGKQKEWELKIAKELKALVSYSSTRVTIKKS